MSSQNMDGFAFHFKLPKEGLALRSVAIKDDTPVLIFDAAMKVPTLTEEDVGIACRLAREGVRPEFFYIPIPHHHPFYGRQYKHYSPQWLRGTSIGELLSETDWSMKCLDIGARSNKNKQKFWAWQETSQLEGLATRLDFPKDKPDGSIIMSCESIEVEKKEDELVFLTEPKMKIDSESSRSYTKYITDIYPSVAYYDEPLFLKMQELIKLVLAAEWLKDKKVTISPVWMKQCSDQQTPSQAIEVKPKLLEQNEIEELNRVADDRMPKSSHQEFGPMSVDIVSEKSIQATGAEYKWTRTMQMQSSLFSAPKVEQTTTIRVSSNDYNMLYSGMNPRMELQLKLPGLCEEITPQVDSWSELFSETVPWPHVWISSKSKEVREVFSGSGGVSTNTIPVTVTEARRKATKVPVTQTQHQDQYSSCSNGHVFVSAQTGVETSTEPMQGGMVPQQRVVSRPNNNVESKTNQTRLNQFVEDKVRKHYGHRDRQSGERVAYDAKGELVTKRPGFRQVIEHKTAIGGVPVPNSDPPTLQPLPLGGQHTQEQVIAQPIGDTNDILSPTSSIASKDSGYSTSSDLPHNGGEDFEKSDGDMDTA